MNINFTKLTPPSVTRDNFSANEIHGRNNIFTVANLQPSLMPLTSTSEPPSLSKIDLHCELLTNSSLCWSDCYEMAASLTGYVCHPNRSRLLTVSLLSLPGSTLYACTLRYIFKWEGPRKLRYSCVCDCNLNLINNIVKILIRIQDMADMGFASRPSRRDRLITTGILFPLFDGSLLRDSHRMLDVRQPQNGANEGKRNEVSKMC